MLKQTFFSFVQLWRLAILKPVIVQRHNVPHFKGLIMLNLYFEAKRHGSTFTFCHGHLKKAISLGKSQKVGSFCKGLYTANKGLTSSLASSHEHLSKAASNKIVALLWATAGGSRFCKINKYEAAVSRSWLPMHSMNSCRGLPTTLNRWGQRATSVFRAHLPKIKEIHEYGYQVHQN